LTVRPHFLTGSSGTRLLQMAQVWQRLADSYANSTTSVFPPVQGEQPTMQQQQKIQPEDKHKKE
jgi:hypothetical protein